MIAMLLAAMLAASNAQSHRVPLVAPTPVRRSQVEMLKDWAFARCLARGAPEPFAHDAAISAAALLERGDYGLDAYTALETLVGQQLKKRYGGSIPGDYTTLKCLDLYHSADLDQLVRRQKATPVR